MKPRRIYHLTHYRNLPSIAEAGRLWSDAKRLQLGLDCQLVGMKTIKSRRLQALDVTCHPGTKVGEYVPFNFCPRSVMLYILHRGNHADLEYRGGQGPMVHLEADLNEVLQWADRCSIRWAFTDRNAGAFLAKISDRPEGLRQLDWRAIDARDFREAAVKESKQAEFLVWESFPWKLVRRGGVRDHEIGEAVDQVIGTGSHRPRVQIKPSWYY